MISFRPRNGDTPSVAMLGTGSAVPDRVVTNSEAGARAEVTDEWVVRKTAIRERRWVTEGQATSDLAVAAGTAALARAGVRPTELSAVVVATSTPDSPQPPTSSVVADRLGVRPGTATFDVNAVCSGFVVALSTVSPMLATAGTGPALVIGADVYSRILDRSDRATVVLFGDGAGAAVLDASPSGDLLGTRTAGFPDRRDLIEVPGGGSRRPPSEEVLRDGAHLFRMQGRKVREFVEGPVTRAIGEFLDDHEVTPGDVAHFVPHQANGRLVAELAEQVGIPAGRVRGTYEELGNTGAASVPVTLDRIARSGRVGHGDLVLLAAFGGGMAMSLALLRAGDGLVYRQPSAS